MSLALADDPSPDDGYQDIRERITAAETYRRPFELGWLSNLAFVAGQHWLVAPRKGSSRQLSHIQDVDPAYEDKELYTADVITEQRGAALGELQTDSDRPELLLPGDGDESPVDEDVQKQANRSVGHGWDYEWDGDATLLDVRSKTIDLGVSAVRCMFDPSLGKPVMAPNPETGAQERVQAPVHHQTGQPITDAAQAHAYVAGRLEQGAPPVQFKEINEGRIQWKVGSAFNLLSPPGIPHEKNFPWEAWVGAAYLPTVKDIYGPAAANLVADEDISSAIGLGTQQSPQTDGSLGNPQQGRLKDHVWLFTYFERPTAQHPQGRVVELAGKNKTLLRVTPKLPYQKLDGTWCSGIVYFHWWRLNDRFYSRSFIEGLKDPQRMINRRRTQSIEIGDRSMPNLMVTEGQLPVKPAGTPMEVVELKNVPGAPPPVYNDRHGPGPWLNQDVEAFREDLSHASTLSVLKLGEVPPNIDTYSGQALAQEQELSKRAVIRTQHQGGVSELVEFSISDIATYWPDGKQLLVGGGPENELQVHEFKKAQIPPLYVVRPAKGTARPRGQASQLQLVTDIGAAAANFGATQQNPLAWVEWLKASYEAGEPLELPQPPVDNQQETAERENIALLTGEQPAVAYWDNAAVHIPVHRQAEDEARVAQDTDALARIEQHIVEHQAVAAQNAQQIAAQQPPPEEPGAGVAVRPPSPQPSPPTGAAA